MNVGSLFSGIGGFDLGLERAGFTTSWFCEADEYCRKVLAKHWPEVPCYPDVRSLRGDSVEPVEVLCGGFPCQDISSAGKGAGIEGARSGLWSEFARLIAELRPRYVLVENVPLLRTRGLEKVLADLVACGYDAEWDGIPARAAGAPHLRDRIWLVAYPQREGELQQEGTLGEIGRRPCNGRRQGGAGADVADANGGVGYPRTGSAGPHGWTESGHGGERGADSWWTTEPDVGRVAHGVPARLDRLTALGNALVPQIAEWLGHRIMDYERSRYGDR